MDFYQDLGFLVFGSRLRRLSEHFLSAVNQVYAAEGIPFEAGWFPIFYLLSQHQPVSNVELAETMVISQPAATQLVATLKKKGLVTIGRDQQDGRKQQIRLTAAGEELLKNVLPVWEAVTKAMNAQLDMQLLNQLTAAEQALKAKPLAAHILEQLDHAKTI